MQDTRGSQVAAEHATDRSGLFYQPAGIRIDRTDDPAHGAAAADMQNKRSGIHLGNRHNSVPLQIILQRLQGTPVGGYCTELAGYESFNLWPTRFLVDFIGPIVADVRISHYDNLTGIGWVREDFLITGHGSVEHNFAGSFTHWRQSPRPQTYSRLPVLESLSFFPGMILRVWRRPCRLTYTESSKPHRQIPFYSTSPTREKGQ